MEYFEVNYLVPNAAAIESCYICGEALQDDRRTDHLIPNGIFVKGSPKRPQLPVHYLCNNTKSREDEWFIRQTQLMSSLNPEAESNVQKLLLKALAQKSDAYIIGKSRGVRDYKFAVGLLDKNVWGLQIKQDGQRRSLLHVGEENSERTAAYVKEMCRGLFMRAVPGSQPGLPRLIGIQYAKARMDGNYESFMQSIETLMSSAGPLGFYQEWKGRVLYAGGRVVESANHGFIFLEFYGEVGYLAVFE